MLIHEMHKLKWYFFQFMLNTCMTSLEPFEQAIFLFLIISVLILSFYSIFTAYFYTLTVGQIVNVFIFFDLYFHG